MKTMKKMSVSETRKKRIRYKLKQTKKLRFSVHISNRHIAAQIIDDRVGHTLAAVSTMSKDFLTAGEAVDKTSLSNVENARIIGRLLAQKALKAGVEDGIVYDRGDKRFHGRVKALADAAREAGLKF